MNTDRNNLIWSQRRYSPVIDPATDQLREVRMRIWTLVRTVLEYAAPYSLVGYTLHAPQNNTGVFFSHTTHHVTPPPPPPVNHIGADWGSQFPCIHRCAPLPNHWPSITAPLTHSTQQCYMRTCNVVVSGMQIARCVCTTLFHITTSLV